MNEVIELNDQRPPHTSVVVSLWHGSGRVVIRTERDGPVSLREVDGIMSSLRQVLAGLEVLPDGALWMHGEPPVLEGYERELE